MTSFHFVAQASPANGRQASQLASPFRSRLHSHPIKSGLGQSLVRTTEVTPIPDFGPDFGPPEKLSTFVDRNPQLHFPVYPATQCEIRFSVVLDRQEIGKSPFAESCNPHFPVSIIPDWGCDSRTHDPDKGLVASHSRCGLIMHFASFAGNSSRYLN
ncbi:uncharacterized protein BDV14DRAFT_13500 [Aspergillus stella-maris]|uniref:uncharacterized protein n=1 Tax=Aspergillus stella-maris TaxID=1810926 RepID=UPI003CCE3D67